MIMLNNVGKTINILDIKLSCYIKNDVVVIFDYYNYM